MIPDPIVVTVDVTQTELFRELVALTTDLLQALPSERQSMFVARVEAIIAHEKVRLEQRAAYRLKDGG